MATKAIHTHGWHASHTRGLTEIDLDSMFNDIDVKEKVEPEKNLSELVNDLKNELDPQIDEYEIWERIWMNQSSLLLRKTRKTMRRTKRNNERDGFI